MSPQKPLEQPITFDQVIAQERKAIRPNEDPAKPATPISALCISGGGIRSATFALGAIQGLAEKGILGAFDYLSTVSGGGYIGSWLTAWKQREDGLDKVSKALMPSAPFPPDDQPDPIQHLREYNNYLSPKLGLFSADTWTLAATVGRNMLLNWLVFVPLLMFLLMAPRLVLSLARFGEALKAWKGQAWIHGLHLERLVAALAGLIFAVAVFNTLRYLPGIGGKEKITAGFLSHFRGKNQNETGFLKYCLLPIILAALGFITLESWFTGGDETGPTDLTYSGLMIWITASAIVGWIAYLIFNFETMKKIRLLLGLTGAILLTVFFTVSCAWLLVAKLYPIMGWAEYVTVAAPLLLLGFMLALVIFVGLTSNVLEDEDREWLSRGGAWLLLFILGWVAICSLVLLAPMWALSGEASAWARSAIAAAGGVGGIVTAVGGFSPKSKAQPQKSGQQENKPPLSSKLIGIALQLAAAVFVVVFLTLLSILTNWLLSLTGVVPADWTNHREFINNTRTRWVVAAAVAFLAFAWIAAKFININRFSLHAMYRNRLIRAYLGASNAHSNANRFTGLAQNDNLQMHNLAAELRPFHVINTTLNLVSGKRLAWQQRKAEAFTISALHCGSTQLGYRPSTGYGGRDGISLGSAMALSGAAASPNMGYYSSAVIGFIMTLFNARLGAWLGNPGRRGASTWQKSGPDSAVNSIVREAFGLTNENCPYVYLSDGGHFENLGIYEMVKRGCRCILVLDGAADGDLKFGDLGNALRKVRIDTKVNIDFETGWEQGLKSRDKRWAVAKICYSDAGMGEDGYLIYVKPLMCGTEPPDVVSYYSANPDFPHQSTANQFFNESQTESYRMLGLHTVREMTKGWDAKTGLQGLQELVKKQQVAKVKPLAAAAEAGR